MTGAGGAVATSYDPAGRLYETSQSGGATSRFLYDGADLAAEYDGSTTLQNCYVQGLGLDTPLVVYMGAGTGSKAWLITDERGSVIAEIDGSGVATPINAHDEYGVPKSGNAGRFGYTGHIWIAEIEAHSYINRVYHPRLEITAYGDDALYEQPWQRVNDIGTFIGVDASVAVAIGIDLQVGFYLPSNGRC